MEIKDGDIIEGYFWPEPVEVKNVEMIGGFVRIIGATLYSNTHIDQLLPTTEVENIKQKRFIRDFTANSEEMFLALEGQRYKNASLFDPLLAMNVSKIDPLPFQIEAVYGYILQLPHIRYLIADDPGAGKTIMAGLIIKELKIRGIVKRILIIVPGHLKDQWIREMKEKFQESFEVIDRNKMNTTYSENPWTKEDQVITSMDFAKQEDILPSLASSEWDLTIIDEAHKFTAYKYGDKIGKSERYKLGEVLSKISEHLLFLTATPHKGDPENYRLFLDLLAPGFFAKTELIEESIKNRDNPLFIRRLKEDMKDFNGKPIFKPRHTFTLKFNLSDKEKNLYNNLSRYVVTEYNKAINLNGKRNIAFALLILQRRMASSTYALLQSLKRRKNRLSQYFSEIEPPLPHTKAIKIEDYEDAEESERWKIENEWETISFAETKEELKREIGIIDNLIKEAEQIISEECEKKLIELKKSIDEGFKKIREVGSSEKILIFTESRDTMEYLYQKIRSWGYRVNFIHGGMPLIERVEAEKIFKNETQIMVATEAAGEGINLQFCNIMINYDIPWNPNRLEQRMGRIHRYGQQYDVYIYNLVAQDTREGEVFAKLFDKLEEIRRAMGNDRVFDIIGEELFGKNLYQLICEAAAGIRSSKEIIEEIDLPVDEEYIAKIKELCGESLATRYIDYSRIKEISEKAKEYKLIPEYIEEFFKKGFIKAGGNYRITHDGFISIDSIPYDIRNIGKETDFKNRYGPLAKSYSKITFDKEIAFKNSDSEFVCFGHPLFEALLEWVKRTFAISLQKGAVFTDPSGRYNGTLWFFEGEVKDGKGEIAGKKLMAILDNGKQITEINPAVIWDLVPTTSTSPLVLTLREDDAKKVMIDVLNRYKEELIQQRKKQAEIKEKYGVRSLEYLRNKTDAELVELYERHEKGEKVDLPILNKKERLNSYKRALTELKNQIRYETTLSFTMPKLIGCVCVVSKTEKGMETDEEIERVGMMIAMEYEKKCGRVPVDVSKENLGFDIRSKGERETRYIEVKARSEEGTIALTPNEWFNAKRFREEYWLYIIANASKNPELYIINNPAKMCFPEEKIEIVRYLIKPDEWKSKGKKT
ncbi:MAG: helicase-related protein [bacterium]|nr:helicase-related protein [bacterium]